MIPVIFINCSGFPFIDHIMTGTKKYETRTKNTMKKLLDSFLGKRILLAQTGNGDPLVRCSAVIDKVIEVYTEDAWIPYIMDADISNGSQYDWQYDTKKKVLYHLTDIKPVNSFRLPKSCKRHGRVWAEFNGSI